MLQGFFDRTRTETLFFRDFFDRTRTETWSI